MTTTSSSARTRTGNFPIGFRRLWLEWHRDLPSLLQWTASENFGVIDLGNDADTLAPEVLKAGLCLGSVDLPEWKGMISANAATRKKAIERNTAYIEACAAFGSLNHFTVMLPENAELPRSENFKYMTESFQKLTPALEAAKAKIVIEGWPGPGVLCCTPEAYAAFFAQCSSPVFGVNYDPSHLLRMGIDPLRFLRESVKRVHHVHGKDTELLDEGLYQYGHEQPATFAKPHGFGGMSWRYTIPGHGVARWSEIFRLLAEAGYKGAVSIELEDEKFNGTPEGEKAGLTLSRDFLSGC